MKEELILLETAKLAREKGFDMEYKEDFYFYHSIQHKYSKYPKKFEYLRVGYDDDLLAPTQSLLQKWLREEHNSHIYIHPVGLGNYKVCHFKSGGYTFCKSEFLTYEDALGYGLMEELKNIE